MGADSGQKQHRPGSVEWIRSQLLALGRLNELDPIKMVTGRRKQRFEALLDYSAVRRLAGEEATRAEAADAFVELVKELIVRLPDDDRLIAEVALASRPDCYEKSIHNRWEGFLQGLIPNEEDFPARRDEVLFELAYAVRVRLEEEQGGLTEPSKAESGREGRDQPTSDEAGNATELVSGVPSSDPDNAHLDELLGLYVQLRQSLEQFLLGISFIFVNALPDYVERFGEPPPPETDEHLLYRFGQFEARLHDPRLRELEEEAEELLSQSVPIWMTATIWTVPLTPLERSALRSAYLSSPHREPAEFFDLLGVDRATDLLTKFGDWLRSCPGKEKCQGSCGPHRVIRRGTELFADWDEMCSILETRLGRSREWQAEMTFDPDSLELSLVRRRIGYTPPEE